MQKIPILSRPLILFYSFDLSCVLQVILVNTSVSTLHGPHGGLLCANARKAPIKVKMYMATNNKHALGQVSLSPHCSFCNYSCNTNESKQLTGCREYFVLATVNTLSPQIPPVESPSWWIPVSWQHTFSSLPCELSNSHKNTPSPRKTNKTKPSPKKYYLCK